MSNRISGIAWDADLPRGEKFILLAMADHADHEGENVRPSVALICHKTGYGRSTVLRLQERLRELGILEVVEVRQAQGRPNLYRIVAESVPLLPPRSAGKPGRKPRPKTGPGFSETPSQNGTTPRPKTGPPPSQNGTTEPTTEPSEQNITPLPPAGAGEVGAEVGDIFPLPQPPRIKDERRRQEAQVVEEVLSDWRTATGRQRFFKPQDDSWKKAAAALRYGFTRAQLRLAVAGALATPWNCGENPHGKKYLNPDNIFRSSEKVDAHMDTARAKLTPQDWWPAPEDGNESPASAAPVAGDDEPGERAMTGFDLDMQALVYELFAPHPDRGRIIAIKKRLGCLGEEVGLRGQVFPPFPEEFEAREVGA
jgi:hypothetical protein